MEQNSAEYKRAEAILFGEDQPVTAKFLLMPIVDGAASEATGRTIYTDQTMIIERVRGDRDYVARNATDVDRRKYPQEFEHFQQALDHLQHPITHVPGIRPSQVEMFRDRAIHTIQAAAAWATPDPELLDSCLKARRWLLIESGEKPRIKLEIAA